MARVWRRITPEKRRRIIRMAAEGKSVYDIAAAVGLSDGAVRIVVRPLGGVYRK